MEMQQIRYFLALARSLNFTRAAEECNVTQPALTRAIQALEAELGGELLRRERTHSHLTELGRRMLPLLQRCHDSALEARELARSVGSGAAAPLALAVSHATNLELFLPALAELFRAHAGVQLGLLRGSGAEILAWLKDGTADLAIAAALPEAWDRLDTWPLFTEGFEVAVHAGNDLAKANDLSPERLAGRRLLLQAGCEPVGEALRRLGIDAATEAAGLRAATQHDLLALLEADLGIAILPASAPQAAGIRRFPLDGGEVPQRTVAAHAVAGRRRSAAAATLLTLLRSADWSRPVPRPG
jgi:DNA-binding transcriptional LysR family regulator